MAPQARQVAPTICFDVPHYSQFLDVADRSWKKNACGVVALASVIDYLKGGRTLLLPLIRKGNHRGAFLPGIGWTHKGIVALAIQAGLYGRNYDWAKCAPKEAFQKLLPYLRRNPVIASIYKDFTPKASGHLIVLTGFDGKKIYYNDPIAKQRNDIKRTISLATFLRGWKRRVIVVHKPR